MEVCPQMRWDNEGPQVLIDFAISADWIASVYSGSGVCPKSRALRPGYFGCLPTTRDVSLSSSEE